MFFLKRRKTNTKAVEPQITGAAAVHMRHYEIASDSMELLQKTLNPKTFFGRCDDIAFSEARITGAPSAFLQDTALLTELQIGLIDRLRDAGRLVSAAESLAPYLGRLTDEALEYYVRTLESQ